MSFLSSHRLVITGEKTTPFVNASNVFPDGAAPMFRDADGLLWAMCGHTHMGEIAMFRGTCLDDMQKLYPIRTLFATGNADAAFCGVVYPEGIRPRGSVWPFGLYICPATHRFFCFFHNESGWNGQGSAYDALGPCETPAFDSDFRHVGLMHSDDEGRTWTFDRWVLTANTVCCTRAFVPDGAPIRGQEMGRVSLGSGDFSFFAPPEGEYLYLFYNIIHVNTDQRGWEDCDVYVARTLRRDDGAMGDFVKYYRGGFTEAGNLGRETPIVRNAWHPHVTWFEKYQTYLMVSSQIRPGGLPGVVRDIMEIRESADMIHWSEPANAEYRGKPFGNHYVALVPEDASSPACSVPGDDFSILTNHNGTDILRHTARFEAI